MTTQQQKLKIVFAGTPQIARVVLAKLLTEYQVELVLTQPDKPSGRGKKIIYGAVKQLAHERNIEVLQPLSVKNNPLLIDKIRSIHPDIMIVVAYGMILPTELLAIPRLGCVNIHVSLLPKWRGAAPIQRAIIAGDDCSGVTIMQMDSGLDTGAILLQQQLPITEDDTAGSLHDKLAELGGKLIIEYLANYQHIQPQVQPEVGVSYAAKIDKAEALIDWRENANIIARKIRGFNPAPGMYSKLDGQIVKIWQAKPADKFTNQPSGTIIAIDNGYISVACGHSTVLNITELQLAGKTRQLARQFILGRANLLGQVFHQE